MAENLRVTKYNDNTAIPQIIDDATWSTLPGGAWCWYDHNPSFNIPYGKLYNWHAVNTGKLCPTSWHVPANFEWTSIVAHLGSGPGGKMKEIGTLHWNEPNTGANNESGFTALPGGNRSPARGFENIGVSGFWWSRTYSDGGFAWFRSIHYNDGDAVDEFDRGVSEGFSVRCVRD